MAQIRRNLFPLSSVSHGHTHTRNHFPFFPSKLCLAPVSHKNFVSPQFSSFLREVNQTFRVFVPPFFRYPFFPTTVEWFRTSYHIYHALFSAGCCCQLVLHHISIAIVKCSLLLVLVQLVRMSDALGMRCCILFKFVWLGMFTNLYFTSLLLLFVRIYLYHLVQYLFCFTVKILVQFIFLDRI